MKKIVLLLFLATSSLTGFAQKNKKTATKAAAAKSVVLLAQDNISAEYMNKKLWVYQTVDGKKDTLFTKLLSTQITKENLVMRPFKAGTKNLYYFNWTEDISSKKDLITETGAVVGTVIFDLENKVKLVDNIDKNLHIAEIHYLSKHKDASETIEKKKREGAQCTLLANGDITLSNKNATTKWVYNATENKYVAEQPKSTGKQNTSTTKKKR